MKFLLRNSFVLFLCAGMVATVYALEQGAPRVPTLLALFLATVIFNLTVEHYIPFNRSAPSRPYGRDLTFTIFNIFVTAKFGEMLMVAAFAFLLEGWFGSHTVFASASLGPLWVQVLAVILINDFCRYWMHFFQHKIPFLWKFHAVHHSVKEIYSLNTFYSHPFDYFLRNATAIPFIMALGFQAEAAAVAIPFVSVAAIFSHSRADFQFKWLNYVFSTNYLHRWHHSVEIEESDRNFGVALIIWDILFGTYYLPKDRPAPAVSGLKDDHPWVPNGFLEVLAYPVMRKSNRD